MAKDVRSVQIVLRLTAGEHAELQALADRLKCSISAAARLAMNDGLRDLEETRRRLKRAPARAHR